MKEIQKINENIKTTMWYSFLTIGISSFTASQIYSLNRQLREDIEEVKLSCLKPTETSFSSSPVDLDDYSPKDVLSPFPPKKRETFAKWQSNRLDYSQMSQLNE